MTELDQIVFAGVGGEGVKLASASFQTDSNADWDGWEGKLKLYARLLSEPPAPPPPTESFTYIAFPDSTAALMRRFAKPGAVGRNTAHALVGEHRMIAQLLPRLAGFTGWYDDAPLQLKLSPAAVADLTAPGTSVVDDELLMPVLAAALKRPGAGCSVIGFPDDPRLRLAVALRLQQLLPGDDWTFSTYEIDDVARTHLPRLIFLASSPTGQRHRQDGRQQVVMGEVLDTQDRWVAAAREMLSGTGNGVVHRAPVQSGGSPAAEPGPRHSQHQPEQPTQVLERVPAPEEPSDVVTRTEGRTRPFTQPQAPPTASLDIAQQVELQQVLFGDGPVTERLRQLMRWVEVVDSWTLRHSAPAWVHDLRLPPSLAVFLIEHLDEWQDPELDRATALRWRAEQRMHLVWQDAGGQTTDTSVHAPDLRPAQAVWEQQQRWSVRAGRAKQWVRACRLFVLLTLVAGAVGAVATAQFSTGDVALMNQVATATAMAMLIGTLTRSAVQPFLTEVWTKARQNSEGLKAAVYRYLAGTGPFGRADAGQMLINLTSGYGKTKTKVAPERVRGLPDFADAAGYRKYRIDRQIEHHEKKAVGYQNALWVAELAGIIVTAVATIFAFIGVYTGQNTLVWVGVCTSVTGAIAAYVTQAGYEQLITGYLRTAGELKDVCERLPKTPDPAAYHEFVTACEHVLELQNKDWLEQLRSSGKARS
ncbi:DUF4231 domain-containing protein [Lentzea sp. NPDC055074]